MASTDSTGLNETYNPPTINASEPRRKVSILTDPPVGGHDNLAFDGPRRKISQVRKLKFGAEVEGRLKV